MPTLRLLWRRVNRASSFPGTGLSPSPRDFFLYFFFVESELLLFICLFTIVHQSRTRAAWVVLSSSAPKLVAQPGWQSDSVWQTETDDSATMLTVSAVLQISMSCWDSFYFHRVAFSLVSVQFLFRLVLPLLVILAVCLYSFTYTCCLSYNFTSEASLLCLFYSKSRHCNYNNINLLLFVSFSYFLTGSVYCYGPLDCSQQCVMCVNSLSVLCGQFVLKTGGHAHLSSAAGFCRWRCSWCTEARSASHADPHSQH